MGVTEDLRPNGEIDSECGCMLLRFFDWDSMPCYCSILSRYLVKLGKLRMTTLRLSIDSQSMAAVITLSTASPHEAATCSNEP